MANALQLRRGTTTQHSTFTGLAGEVTVDTTKDTVVVHDGATAGGIPLATEDSVSASNLLTAIKTVDGAGSGLDADLLDGQTGTYYTNYADTAVANLVASAPSTLDTLNELAAALGDDPNFATTVTNSIATKLDSSSYTAADVLTKIKTVDGAGSGLDADLWDGNQFSSYLNQALLTTSSPTFSNSYLDGAIYHNGDPDTYIQFDAADSFRIITGNGQRLKADSNGVKLGDAGNGYFRPVSGSYGSIEIDGGAHTGWEGYSIGGRVVFMHDNNLDAGLYDDVNNNWLFLSSLNGASQIYHAGASKIQTTSSGANITGSLTTDGLTVDGSVDVNGTLEIEEVSEKFVTSASTSGTATFNTSEYGVLYYTANQTANRTINFINVNSRILVGQSVTCSVLMTQGSTAYYLNAYQVDGTAVTPKWSGGSAPSAGNASGIDVYTFTIIKTANATFTVLASLTQYA